MGMGCSRARSLGPCRARGPSRDEQLASCAQRNHGGGSIAHTSRCAFAVLQPVCGLTFAGRGLAIVALDLAAIGASVSRYWTSEWATGLTWSSSFFLFDFLALTPRFRDNERPRFPNVARALLDGLNPRPRRPKARSYEQRVFRNHECQDGTHRPISRNDNEDYGDRQRASSFHGREPAQPRMARAAGASVPRMARSPVARSRVGNPAKVRGQPPDRGGCEVDGGDPPGGFPRICADLW
jgi:hypothetical protein